MLLLVGWDELQEHGCTPCICTLATVSRRKTCLRSQSVAGCCMLGICTKESPLDVYQHHPPASPVQMPAQLQRLRALGTCVSTCRHEWQFSSSQGQRFGNLLAASDAANGNLVGAFCGHCVPTHMSVNSVDGRARRLIPAGCSPCCRGGHNPAERPLLYQGILTAHTGHNLSLWYF